MTGDLISINGGITAPGGVEFDPPAVLGLNFVYQRIHTLGGVPLRCADHAGIIGTSYETLYGVPAGISEQTLRNEIKAVLAANRYSAASNQVVVYLLPADGDRTPTRVICCEKPLPYKGYAMRHVGMSAMVIPYEYPFAPYKTAVSLAAHTCAADYARRMGADVAIAENYDGILTGVGENPLFAVVRDVVFTTPIDDGAADSAERRLGIEACGRASVGIIEAPLRTDLMNDYDEMFTVTPQGIASISRCGDRTMLHSMARNLAGWMKGMTDDDAA